jgi:hypothetical protein
MNCTHLKLNQRGLDSSAPQAPQVYHLGALSDTKNRRLRASHSCYWTAKKIYLLCS